jgi:divalent metal cation (Fe/Co/Zn/Cd) transporter
LLEPHLPEFKLLTVVILSVSILVKLYICLYNRKYGKWINSAAMMATASDSLGDVMSTAAVLVSGIITYFTNFIYLDAICGLAVSIFIFVAGSKAAKETISPLLGQPPSPEFVKRVEEIALSDDKIIGLHDMMVHDYGPGRVMVSLHCEVSSEDDIIELHEVIDGLEIRISEELNCNALIHMDPVDTNDGELASLRPIVLTAVKELCQTASFHDLRVVRASDHLNVLFDVLLPFDASIDEKEAVSRLTGAIKDKKPECECIIKIDTDFVGRI